MRIHNQREGKLEKVKFLDENFLAQEWEKLIGRRETLSRCWKGWEELHGRKWRIERKFMLSFVEIMNRAFKIQIA